jgi:hypothetical protein
MAQTPTLHLTQPTIGGDTGPIWPNFINNDLTLVDRGVNGILDVTIPDANVTLVADGTVNDQSVYAVYRFNGALTANRTVRFPANFRIGAAVNNTTGGHNVILRANATTNQMTLPPDGQFARFQSNGTDVFAVPVAMGDYTAAASGHTTLGGGFILNWGVTAGGSIGGATITFEQAYSSAVYSIQTTPLTSGDFSSPDQASVNTVTLTNFRIRTPSTAQFYWQAIGR